MKAIAYTKYGPPHVLKLVNTGKPRPAANEVLIKVMATTATAAEGLMRQGNTTLSRLLLGLRKPRKRFQIMGIEIAGDVEQLGCRVTKFRPGDRVFGFTGFSVGAYAQYACLPENSCLTTIPAGMSYEHAASIVDGATTALFFLYGKAGLRRGDKVLVIGASGSIGTAAVQIASDAGAVVTGVCSGKNTTLVRSLGASSVVDYAQADFTANGKTYDIIFDTVSRSSFGQCKGSLRRPIIMT